MKNHLICIAIALGLSAGTYYLGTVTGQSISCTRISQDHCALRTTMRKLWSDHVWWTRDYLIVAIANMPDVKPTAERLLKNQEEIGEAIEPFYGEEAGEKLGELLKEHILIAVDVVAAAKAGDDEKLKIMDNKWHHNALEIAQFLHTANPHLPEKTVKDMLDEHLKVTTQEAVARLKQDWKADIKAFDKILDDMLMMADAITEGIVKQFPDKF